MLPASSALRAGSARGDVRAATWCCIRTNHSDYSISYHIMCIIPSYSCIICYIIVYIYIYIYVYIYTYIRRFARDVYEEPASAVRCDMVLHRALRASHL